MSKWFCTDDSCAQHVRKLSETRFELIEIGRCTPDTFEVYTDVIETGDYLRDENRSEEVKSILSSFGYESLSALQEHYPDEWKQVLAECIFEHYGNFQAEVLAENLREEKAIRFVQDYIQKRGDCG